MKEYMHPMELARAFSLGTLANEVEFSVEEYKKGVTRLTEKEKDSLLAAKSFLENILNFERDEMGRNGTRVKRGALPKLELLEASGSIVNAWIRSEIPFPKSDEEFEHELQLFVHTLEKMAGGKAIVEVGMERINNIKRLFSTLGEMALRKVHVSSLYDRL